MTTNAPSSHPSILTRTRQNLQARQGVRYAILGAVLLILAVTRLVTTVEGDTGFTGNRVLQLAMAGIGTAFVVLGVVKARRR